VGILNSGAKLTKKGLDNPRPDRPGLWEFRHNDDGHTEEIRLRFLTSMTDGLAELRPVTDMPDVDLEEMFQAGCFTRFLGP
jgi:hypothetical protein